MRKLGILLILVTLLSIGLASAALTYVPASGSVINSISKVPCGDGICESTHINVTSTTGPAFNVTNMSITCTHSITGEVVSNTTLVGLTGCNNLTATPASNNGLGRRGLNCSIQTFVGEDGTYSCAFVAYNGSADGTSNTETGTATYIIDNSAPTSCTHSLVSGGEYPPDQTWTVTGVNASSATIQFGESGSWYTMAIGGKTPVTNETFTYTGKIPEGTYQSVIATISDGTNTSRCDIEYISIDSKATAVQIATIMSGQGQKEAEAGGNGNMLLLLAGAAAVIILIKKKK